jgi:hypothetical protein
MRTIRILVFAIVFASFVVHTGCGRDRATRKHTDAASQARLKGIEEGEDVLVSIRTGDPEAAFPVGREILRVDGALLGAVPREELDELADVPGLTGISVWGSSAALDKAGPRLRTELLTAWVEAPEEPLPLLVQLEEGAPDVRGQLEGCGATTRTVAGEVVTVDADPEAVFCILQLQAVTRISAPRALRPSGG